MLKHIRLIDFKSFVDEQVDLAPLTLLVGVNAAGKSNVFDALRFLSKLPEIPVADVLNGRGGGSTASDEWTGIRGKAAEAPRVGCSTFEVRTAWRDRWNHPAWHAIGCSSDGAKAAGIRNEQVGRHEGDGVYEQTAAGHRDPVMGGLSLLAGPAPDEEGAGCVKSLRKLFRAIRLLDPRPERMRDFGRRGQPLGPHGENLSGVLADLCADPAERRGFVEWLAELCAPELTDLDFITVPELGDVMAVAIERGGKRISARSLSDGTLRFLGLLLALRTAEPGSCLLAEEIDAGLHPTRIRLLVEYLETVTRERGIQVIATTHSPAVLRWLSDESLRNVVLCAVVPEHEGTLLRRLGDLPHFDEVVKRKGIEELFSTGWLEMAV